MGRFAVILLAVIFALPCKSQKVKGALDKQVISYFDLTSNIGLVHRDDYNNSADTMKGGLYYKNRAYYFDGSADYISCPFNSRYDITNSFTFAVWSKPDDLSKANFTSIFGRQNSLANNSVWALTFELTADSYSLYSAGQTGTSPYANSHLLVTDNRWHLVVYTYNGATFNKYLDGVLKGTYSMTFSFAASTKPMTFGIGDSGNSAATSMQGSLAKGMLLSRPLTASEVWAMYIKDKPFYNY